MKERKNQNGITLIALIITIVVLLILAVVAIREVTGDGIITHAIQAREKAEMAKIKEEAELVKAEYLIDYHTEKSDALKMEQSILLIKLKAHFERNIRRK